MPNKNGMSRRPPGSRWGNGGGGDRSGRWDRSDRHRDRNPRQDRPARQKPSVSDEDALRALLGSAEERSSEREGRNQHHNQHRGGGRGSGRGSRDSDFRGRDKPSRSRWGNNDNNNNNSNRNNNAAYDRKRQRPTESEGDRDRHRPRADYYGPSRVEDETEGSEPATAEGGTDTKAPPEFKPNFGLSGALAKDTETGNVYKGVLLKFREPPEARAPNTRWRFYVFKPTPKPNHESGDRTSRGSAESDLVDTIHVGKQSAYLFGRNTDVADVPLLHPSLSGQHAVLQYRGVLAPPDRPGGPGRTVCKPYLMDLESTNGTFLNGVRIDPARYYELKKGDVLTFGASTREYVLLTENTTAVE